MCVSTGCCMKEPVLSYSRMILYQQPCSEVVEYNKKCNIKKGKEYFNHPHNISKECPGTDGLKIIVNCITCCGVFLTMYCDNHEVLVDKFIAIIVCPLISHYITCYIHCTTIKFISTYFSL